MSPSLLDSIGYSGRLAAAEMCRSILRLKVNNAILCLVAVARLELIADEELSLKRSMKPPLALGTAVSQTTGTKA